MIKYYDVILISYQKVSKGNAYILIRNIPLSGVISNMVEIEGKKLISATVQVISDGKKITVPKEVRDLLNITASDFIEIFFGQNLGKATKKIAAQRLEILEKGEKKHGNTTRND